MVDANLEKWWTRFVPDGTEWLTGSEKPSNMQRPLERELVLEAAVSGGADALVRHNVGDFRTAAPRFGLRVLLPRELMKELEP